MENVTKKILELRNEAEPKKETLEMHTNFFSITVSECTTPLLDQIFEMDVDFKSISNLQEYLWNLYDQESYLAIMGIIKSQYLINGLEIPPILDAIVLNKEDTLQSLFAYELLMDMGERIEDYGLELNGEE